MQFEVTWVSGGLDEVLLLGHQNYQALILETTPDTDGLRGSYNPKQIYQ